MTNEKKRGVKNMDAIKENTVSAENQMIHSDEISFLGSQEAKTRILVVGNSITRHGPLKEIGWENDWGMAASSPEKDYVHRVYAKLQERGKDVFMRIRQCAFWERNYLDDSILSKYEEERNFHANVIVFRLGENVAEKDKPYFEDALERWIDYLCDKNGKVVFSTCFWHNRIIDGAIENIARKRNCPLITLGDLGERSDMKAKGLFWHTGVAAHPGDRGMEEIAERILKQLDLLI